MKSNAQVKEKRRSPRRAALMPAVIFYPNQNEHVGCMVRDLSQDGALLELPLAKELPLIFWLRLTGETTLRFCNVAWHSENYLGVEFSEQITERRRAERWASRSACASSPRSRSEKFILNSYNAFLPIIPLGIEEDVHVTRRIGHFSKQFGR